MRGRVVAELDRDEGAAVAAGQADDTVAGRARVAGLHAVRTRIRAQQQVQVPQVQEPAGWPGDPVVLGGDHLREDGIGEREPRERREVADGRVAAVAQPVRARVPRVAQAEGCGLVVHQPDEVGLAPGDMLGERHGGVVPRPKEQPVQERQHLDALAGAQADVRRRRREGLSTDDDVIVERGPLQDEERGHDLREARDRTALVLLLREHDPARSKINQDRRRGAHERQAHGRGPQVGSRRSGGGRRYRGGGNRHPRTIAQQDRAGGALPDRAAERHEG